MTLELSLLGWTLLLALFQIVLPAMLRNRETGVSYNAGSRDEEGPPVGRLTGRMMRARGNLLETLPIFAAAVLIVHVAGREGTLSHFAVWLYFIARVVYVPLYAAGIPYLRSLVWLGSLIGIVLLLVTML